MTDGKFVRGASVTLASNVFNLLIGLGTSVILARVLGPEGKGIYTLAILLPTLIVTFGNLGIGPATVYYVARGEYSRQEILGNNVLLSIAFGIIGIFIGLLIIVFFHDQLFPNVDSTYLFLALAFIPAQLFLAYTKNILLGAQHIRAFNYVQIIQSLLFFLFIIIILLGMKGGVLGAILAGLATWLLVVIIVFRWVIKVAGGISFTLNTSYLRRALTYGAQAHLSNTMAFLNYKLDVFLVSGYLGPTAVGLYSVGTALTEKLWMVSQSASTVLFPRVAAESEEERQKEFTPLVARTVLWIAAISGIILVFLSRWIVLLLYSKAYLPAVGALQALLVGVVALSVGRVLANDIAGRGFPALNVYTGVTAVIVNVALNILWIPRYGIVGAAWASTASYTISSLGSLFFYCRLSNNSWVKILIPQRSDWTLYWRIAKAFGHRGRSWLRIAPKRAPDRD